jgi:hypothetical protein
MWISILMIIQIDLHAFSVFFSILQKAPYMLYALNLPTFQYFKNFISIYAQNSIKILTNTYTWRHWKPLLSRLSIESTPGSEEGGGDQQMTPELLNEASSVKAHDENIQNPMKLCFDIKMSRSRGNSQRYIDKQMNRT